MLTALSHLSRSLSAVVDASAGASVFSLFLQACCLGDDSSKAALGLVWGQPAGRAAPPPPRLAGGQRPRRPWGSGGAGADPGLVMPTASREQAPLRLLPHIRLPQSSTSPRRSVRAGKGSSGASQVRATDALGCPSHGGG